MPNEKLLLDVEGVENITTTGDTIRITCASQDVKMRALTQLNEVTTVRDFDTEDTSLESVFEAFAGSGDATQPNMTASRGDHR